MSQPFVKLNFIVLAWHYAIILAYCELQAVRFERLVLPYHDNGQSLYAFLKDGYIPEALLSNTNPNNWGDSLVTKLVLATWKSLIVVTIGFTKFAKILIVKIKSNFHRTPNFTIKVNIENQWFCRYCIGIYQLPYEIIDIFVNLCLENKEMHSITALVCKKWRSISIKSLLKSNF